MSLSRLAVKCRACPFVDSCDNKEMEAYGFLPLPPKDGAVISSESSEASARQTAKGYRNIENFLDNPQFLITSDGATPIRTETSGEVNTDVDKLVRTIAGVVQLPEKVLRGGRI